MLTKQTTDTEISLIDFFLEEQSLTAVEKFSKLYESQQIPNQQNHYRDLIPLDKPGEGQQYAFEVDLDKCTGCKACVTACHSLNGLDATETWRSVGLIYENRGQDLTRKRILPRITFSEFDYPEPELPLIPLNEPLTQPLLQHVTSACHHCVEPGCLSGCPVKAYEKDPLTGIVQHLDDQCIGCKYCLLMCPYDVPQYNAQQGIVRKCNMCADRLAVGEAPACVQSCPTQAIKITVVQTEAVKQNPNVYVNIPGAPDSHHTKPTTTFKTSQELPATMQSIDHHHIQPWHPEFPLLFMLILTQLAAGAVLLETVLGRLLHMSVIASVSPYLTLFAFLIATAGLGIVQLHLGRPLLAFRSFLGLKTSWLSREAIVAAGFVGLLGLYTVLQWLPTLEWLKIAVALPLSASAIALIGSSAMVYKVTPRDFWRGYQAIIKFSLTAVILGSVMLLFNVIMATALQSGQSLPSSLLNPVAILLIVGTIAKLSYEYSIFTHLQDKRLTSLKKSALLHQGRFLHLTQSRFISGGFGGILLPIALLSDISVSGAVVVISLTLILTLLGEILERYLFFRCAVAPKMPGLPSGNNHS